MQNLEGKVAVVTGGASGIGRALAERFARERMKIVLSDVEEGPLGAARDALVQGGADVLAVRTDVSKAADVDELALRTFAKFGTAHLVCNNAGVGASGLMWKVPERDWAWILGVNLMGVVHGVRAFVPRLIEQGEGHVVNTASIAGMLTGPGMAPYCATKHAVVAMSECLYHELAMVTGGKVKVSVLCPAWVKTRIIEAERNRPQDAPLPDRPPTPQEQMFQSVVRAAVESGIPPEVVADKVLKAVLGDQFYILTHGKTKKAVEKRMRGILDDALPELNPIGG